MEGGDRGRRGREVGRGGEGVNYFSCLKLRFCLTTVSDIMIILY